MPITRAYGQASQLGNTPAASNPVINGAFDIWQRGTSISYTQNSGIIYNADRWYAATGANQACTISRQATSDTTNLPNIQYGLRFQRNSGQTGTSGMNLVTSFETVNSIPFAGKTITLSFYARAGANYSPTSSLLYAQVWSGTGTDQNFLSPGYTGSSAFISQTATLTTTWQRFSYTGSVASTATELSVLFQWLPTGTAGAADYFEVTGVQLDIGSVALPFRRTGGTLAGELAACQRYYQKSYNQADSPTTVSASGYQSLVVPSNTIANQTRYGTVFLKTTMRTAPTLTIRPYSTPTNTGRVSDSGGNDLGASSGVALSASIGQNSFALINDSGGNLTTTNFGVIFHWEASSEL